MATNRDNPNCDGAGPHSPDPETRKYPLGGGSNAILCRACVARENSFRPTIPMENRPKRQPWETLKVYPSAD